MSDELSEPDAAPTEPDEEAAAPGDFLGRAVSDGGDYLGRDVVDGADFLGRAVS